MRCGSICGASSFARAWKYAGTNASRLVLSRVSSRSSRSVRVMFEVCNSPDRSWFCLFFYLEFEWQRMTFPAADLRLSHSMLHLFTVRADLHTPLKKG